jgi:hypothetical protein
MTQTSTLQHAPAAISVTPLSDHASLDQFHGTEFFAEEIDLFGKIDFGPGYGCGGTIDDGPDCDAECVD